MSVKHGLLALLERGARYGYQLRAEFEDSLQRLQTDRVDLYYLHRVDPEVELETSLTAIKEYSDAGQIGEVGGKRSDMIEAGDKRKCPAARKAAERRLDAPDPAQRGRDTDRAIGIGAQRDIDHARRNGCRRPAR